MYLASVARGFSHIGSWIKDIFTDPPCECCEIYKEVLETESQRARYYERLLLKRLGIVSDDTEVAQDVEYLPTFSATATLSQIRRRAERKFALKEDKPAEQSELSEAEQLFEASLNKEGQTSNV